MKTAKEFLLEHWYFKNNFENPANKLLIKDVIDMMERYAEQFKISSNPMLSDSLLAFYQWMKENKHRYMFTDDKRFIEEFLKASNVR